MFETDSKIEISQSSVYCSISYAVIDISDWSRRSCTQAEINKVNPLHLQVKMYAEKCTYVVKDPLSLDKKTSGFSSMCCRYVKFPLFERDAFTFRVFYPEISNQPSTKNEMMGVL